MKKIPNYFELTDKNVLAIREAANNIITQSEMMTRAACPRKWFYRYALMLDRTGTPNFNLIYGTMMHSALAKLYGEGHYGENPREYPIIVPKITIPEEVILTPQDLAEMDLTKAKTQIFFDAYRWYYYKMDSYMRVIMVEENLDLKWKGLRLQGRIDMAAHPKVRDALFIWDWKTAGRFDASMLDAWSFRFQFLFYAWLYWKCIGVKPAGIMTNGLAKTMLRPKIADKKTGRKETVKQYLDRVKANVRDNREKFFYRQRMPFTTGTLERFEVDILGPHIGSFLLLKSKPANPTVLTNLEIQEMNSLAMAMNTGHCHIYNSFCEFLPLCKDGPLMLEEYSKREVKHIELDTEIEVGEA